MSRHTAALHDVYHPAPGQESWWIAQAAQAAARLDHCQFMIRAHLDDQMDRADLCWDQDHELAAEEVASRLSKDPARVVKRLRQTAHGCRWLINHWKALGQAVADHQTWNDDQLNHAFHLLGVTPELRPLHAYLHPDANPNDLADLVARQLADLQSLLDDALIPLDHKARELARLGYPLQPSKELLRLQRSEASLRKVYHDSLHQFRLLRAETAPDLEPSNRPSPSSRPGTRAGGPPDPQPNPPSTDRASLSSILALVGETTTSTPPQPAAPLNRKARRALEKAARAARQRSSR